MYPFMFYRYPVPTVDTGITICALQSTNCHHRPWKPFHSSAKRVRHSTAKGDSITLLTSNDGAKPVHELESKGLCTPFSKCHFFWFPKVLVQMFALFFLNFISYSHAMYAYSKCLRRISNYGACSSLCDCCYVWFSIVCTICFLKQKLTWYVCHEWNNRHKYVLCILYRRTASRSSTCKELEYYWLQFHLLKRYLWSPYQRFPWYFIESLTNGLRSALQYQ